MAHGHSTSNVSEQGLLDFQLWRREWGGGGERLELHRPEPLWLPGGDAEPNFSNGDIGMFTISALRGPGHVIVWQIG